MLRSLLLLGVLSMAAAPPLSAQPPQLVRDFWPGEVVSGLLNHGRPMAFRLHGDDLLVFANDGNGAAKLFRLNDLSGNVQELAHVGAPAGYTTTNGGIITSDDNIYFFAQQAGSTNHLLWCVRPGQAAEQLMTLPYSILFGHVGIPLPGGRLLFPGHSTDHGYELWVTDGTTAGTQLVKDINPGTGTPFGSPLPIFQGFDFNGKGYFLANDGSTGPQLWVSDGTPAGTQQFATINPASATGSVTLLWSRNQERFVVTAHTGLIASDGSTENTSLIHPGNYAMAHIPGLNHHVDANGWMYFSALENSTWKLYRTLGTSSSTQLVLEGQMPNQGFPYMTELGGMLYVLTGDGNQNTVLARIDPAAQSLSVVKTFTSTQGINGVSNFYGFRNDGQHIYFMGRADAHARQYWKSDGTEAGTEMVFAFTPTVINGGPDAADGNMILFQNSFVFAANDAGVGIELFAGEGVVGVEEARTAAPLLHAWVDASGRLTAVLPGRIMEAAWLLDATGRRVRAWKGRATDRLEMSVDGLSSGVHLLQVQAEGARYACRLLVP